MREARWYPQLLLVFGGQNFRHPLAIGRRSGADIHRHVEHLTGHDTHQFALGMRRKLIMQTAQNATG
jgi:hypothetical protein